MSRTYQPNGWVALKKIEPKGEAAYYKIFGSWNGGYLDGDSWRLSSGGSVQDIVEKDTEYHWVQHSGSEYTLNKHREGCLSAYNSFVLNNMLNEAQEQQTIIQVLPIRDIIESETG